MTDDESGDDDRDELSFNPKTALPVASDATKLSAKFECCMVLHFQVNGRHGTDRWTDEQTECNIFKLLTRNGAQVHENDPTASKYENIFRV